MGKKGAVQQESKEEIERKNLIRSVQLKEWRKQEEKISKVNNVKIDTNWRTKLRQEKAKQLKKETELVKQSHERKVDHQDSLLSAIEQELEDSEVQLQFAVRGQLMNQEDLLDLQTNRIQKAYERFNSDMSAVETEFTSERARMVAQHEKDKEELSAIFLRMQAEFHESEAQARHDYQSQRDDANNRHEEEKQALRLQLEAVNEDLWKQFQKALDEYNQATAERKNQFDLLKSKDIESSKVIDFQTKRLIKIQDSIAALKGKLASNNRDYEDKVKQMKAQKDALQTQFQEMKRKMALFRGEERKKLTSLTVLSASVLDILKDKVAQAERILKLVEFSAPLETANDHQWNKFEVELDEGSKAMLQKEDEHIKKILDGTPFTPQERIAMVMFYKRYNKIFLDKFNLEKRKEMLMAEQATLKSKLKCYFDGMAVSDRILKEENTLLVVNGKTNALECGDKREVIPHVHGPLLLKTQQIQFSG